MAHLGNVHPLSDGDAVNVLQSTGKQRKRIVSFSDAEFKFVSPEMVCVSELVGTSNQ